MSYCRFASVGSAREFGDEPSDLYVYLDCSGYFRCCACRITGMSGNWSYYSTDDMIAHVREHIAAGHAVPSDVIPRLEDERAENDAFISA